MILWCLTITYERVELAVYYNLLVTNLNELFYANIGISLKLSILFEKCWMHYIR